MVDLSKKQKVQAILDELDPEDILGILQELKKKKTENSDTDEKFDDPIQTSGKVVKRDSRPNKFLEMKFSKKEKQQLEEDKLLDQLLLKNYEPTPRERDKVELIEVRCSVCGKTDRVSPTLVFNKERYRCNTCYQGK